MLKVIGRIFKHAALTAVFAVSSYATAFIGGAYISGGPTLIGNNSNDARQIALLYSQETITNDIDTDGDGLSDSVETNTGIYVSSTDTGTDPNNVDSDGDGLSDGAEINTYGSNPNLVDTDGDGVSDGLEITEGTDPLDASSYNSFSTGLVAYYPFNGNANDESVYSNDGTISGATLTADRFGNAISAFDFDGVDDFISISDSSSLNIGSQSFSLSTWARVVSDPTQPTSGLISNYRGSSPPEFLTLWHVNQYNGLNQTWEFSTRDSNDQKIDLNSTDGSAVPGIWVHILGVRDEESEVTKLFVNGILIDSVTDKRTGSFTGSSSGQYWIGATSLWPQALAPGNFFTGSLDDIRIYDRALSTSEVSALYKSEAPQFQIIQGRWESLSAIQSDAISRGGGLAILDTADKHQNAINILSQKWVDSGIESAAAFGLSNNGNGWTWRSGQILAQDNFFRDGEGLDTPPTVAFLDSNTADWIDGQISEQQPATFYILEALPQFQIIESSLTWTEAKADAESRGGRLAVLNTQLKINAANSYLNDLGSWPNLWIGLTDQEVEGSWKWVNGEALTDNNWEPSFGEPNGGITENYAEIMASLKWNDTSHSASPLRGYLLEIPSNNIDTDSDGLLDVNETNTGIYLSETDTGTDPNNPDSDGDGLSDGAEINTYGSNPNLVDTDGDGVSDGLEITEGTDPLDASSYNSFSTGLIAYYPFNGNANDESGNGHNGTNNNASLSSDRFGNASCSYAFNGTSSYIEMQDSSDFTTSSLTLSAYVKTNSNKISQTIFSNYGNYEVPSNNWYTLHLYPNLSPSIQIDNGSSFPVLISSQQIDSDAWYHIVGLYDDTEQVFRTYINGELTGESYISFVSPIDPTGNPTIGMQLNHFTDRYFSGQIDDVRIYNRALSTNEVRALYYSEAPQFQIIEGVFTWQEAKADAESRGGRLAVLNTQAKIDVINSHLSGLGSWPYLFIGLTDEEVEGDWRWITGESLTISNWRPGEPTNTGVNDDYGVIRGTETNSLKYWLSTTGNSASYILEMQTGLDSDGDGLYDRAETNTGTFVSVTDTGTDPNIPDSDGDSLSDGIETNTGIYVSSTDTGTDPNNVDVLYTATQVNTSVATSRTLGQQDVTAAPGDFGLHTPAEMSSNRTLGQQDVTSNPSDYNLHTPNEMTTARSESRTLGRADVTDAPGDYYLHTPTEMTTARSESRTLGQADVTNDPGTYDLHTPTEMTLARSESRILGRADVTDAPGDYYLHTPSEMTAARSDSRTLGQKDVTTTPSNYNLHTPSEMTLARSESRILGRADVTDAPGDYYLHTPSEMTAARSESRTLGQTDVTGNPDNYSLRTTDESKVQAVGVNSLLMKPDVNNEDQFQIDLKLQKSNDMEVWHSWKDYSETMPKSAGKEFIRVKIMTTPEEDVPESLPTISTDTYGDKLVYDESNNLYVNDENTPLRNRDGLNLRTDTYPGWNFYAIESTSSGYLCLLKNANQNAIITFSQDGNYLSVSLIYDLSAYESDFGQSLD